MSNLLGIKRTPLKILLTGIHGQVGFELQRSLQGLGELVALDRSQLDLADLAQVREVVRSVQPGLIINPAAYTAVDKAESEKELAFRINAQAVEVMAQEAQRLHATMIHYSTDYVYDGSKQGRYLESDATAPLGVYGASKLAGEDAIRASGIAHLIFRTSWVYGTRGKNFLLTMQRLLQERDELRVVADQVGAPTWSRSIADATAHVLAQARACEDSAAWWQQHSGVYHLTCQGETSWHGFTNAIMSHSQLSKPVTLTPITSAEYPTPAKRPANSRLVCDKFQTSFCELPTWQTALALCVAK